VQQRPPTPAFNTRIAERYPLARERAVIIAVLLAFAAIAWALIVWQSSMREDDEMMTPTMGLTAPLFLGIWVAMMVAMMFPTAMPMILAFARVQSGKAARDQATVPVALFVGAYLLIWVIFGVAAFAVTSIAEVLADRSMWLMDNAGRIGGVLLVAAGIYQASPLKRICLSKCRSPMSWLLYSWREGPAGAVRMGIEHGAYCLGCCWLLFVILFPLGMMNIAAMAAITALIFAEKSLPLSGPLTRAAATVLIAYGVLVLAYPGILPTTM
jgi:predicted metal-binding membrane protein